MLLSGCAAVKENPKYAFSTGIYYARTSLMIDKVYVEVDGDHLRLYAADKHGKYDSSRYQQVALNSFSTDRRNDKFTKYSLDLDLVSLPLKFRPAQPGFPHQLNTTINGGIYLGRRADVYRIRNTQTKIGGNRSTINHLGFSGGVFAGVGSTPMNPSVTENRITIEYDGLVIPVGLTALAAHNELTFGLTVGIDYMPHDNRKVWIYRNKPWVGLAIGLNLN